MLDPIHMIRLSIDTSKMMEYGRRIGLPIRNVDAGYLVHCQLTELFGSQCPKPFSIQGQSGRMLEVLGYSSGDAASLVKYADSFADPWLHGSVDWSTLSSKPMPSSWEVGQRLGFEVRACPVKRMARGSTRIRPGAEVDVFLAHCSAEAKDQGEDRARVYRDWLKEQVDRMGGASIVRSELVGFHIDRMLRRKQGETRTSSISDRPTAVFRGLLEVRNPTAFSGSLARGVGRHRAFGYGMLLLRPPTC